MRETVADRSAQPLIDEVVAEMHTMLDDAASVVSDAIHANIPGLSPDLYQSTRQSTRANVGLITTMIGNGEDPTTLAVPAEALAYARSYVHEGLSFESLTAVYREGQRAFLNLWLDRVDERATDTVQLTSALRFLSDWLFRYIETIIGGLAEAYFDERERWVRGGMAIRAEEVRSLLAGGHVDDEESSRRLRYRLGARHIGFVVYSLRADVMPEGDHALFADMERYAAEVAESLGASGSLTLPIGRLFAGWAAVDASSDPAAVQRTQKDLGVAFGRPATGVEGFRASHQEALLARRIATLTARPTAVVAYDAVALDALLVADLEHARRFVEHEVGPLLEETDAVRRLLATLEVFLQEESSYVRAARRLSIHENTVSYRVKRAEEILGRKTTDRQLELRTALRLARLVRE
ncbi:MAG: hypothetical protein QOF76_5185 [Solirubrobacteraceae bacterium]|jgi:hypothetical protein|nr:hypothetical protein [Solirubrobacteraceae bacterium]